MSTSAVLKALLARRMAVELDLDRVGIQAPIMDVPQPFIPTLGRLNGASRAFRQFDPDDVLKTPEWMAVRTQQHLEEAGLVCRRVLHEQASYSGLLNSMRPPSRNGLILIKIAGAALDPTTRPASKLLDRSRNNA